MNRRQFLRRSGSVVAVGLLGLRLAQIFRDTRKVAQVPPIIYRESLRSFDGDDSMEPVKQSAHILTVTCFACGKPMLPSTARMAPSDIHLWGREEYQGTPLQFYCQACYTEMMAAYLDLPDSRCFPGLPATMKQSNETYRTVEPSPAV